MARNKLAKVWEFRSPAVQSGTADAAWPVRDKPGLKARSNPRAARRAGDSRDLKQRVIRYALKHLERFASLEPKVLQGKDPWAIHDIRVATRRVQTAMDLLIPKPRPAAFRKPRQRLKRCRRTLSEVRNCDAIAARADAVLGRKRASRRAAWLAFRQFLEARRSKLFSKAVNKLGKLNLDTSYLQLKRLLEQVGRQPLIDAEEPDGREAGKLSTGGFETELLSRLDHAREIFENRLEACVAKPGAQSSHQVRIAAKRLRYVIEILHDCGIPGSSDALVWFRSIQTQLGDLHDTDIQEEMLIEMIGRPRYLRENLELSFQVARLVVKARLRKQVLLERFVRKIADSGEYERIHGWFAGLPERLVAAARKA